MVRSNKGANQGYWDYARNFAYSPAGAVTSVQLGNGRWESTLFNSRLQPTEIRLGGTNGSYDALRLQYSYGEWSGASVDATKNSGNIAQQTITVPNSPGHTDGFQATQKYYYDPLNRLDDSTEEVNNSQTWRQDFSYDRYGNRSLVEANTTTIPRSCGAAPSYSICTDDRKRLNPAANISNNRLSAADGYSYDPAGNTTKDPQSRKFTYDAENKQTKVETLDPNGGVAGILGEYSYDGDGRRVKKCVPSTGETTVFVYDAGGKQIAEYSTIVAPQTQAKVNYLTSDHLGSPRVDTDQSGAVISRHDYHPFGEEISTQQRLNHPEYAGDRVRKQFTGYERDTETELDFAQARYYAKELGRFSSPDPLLTSATISSPQTWNRFKYALNNPLLFVDPLGLYEWAESAGGSASDDELRARSKNKALKKEERTKARRQLNFRERFEAGRKLGAEMGNEATKRAVGSYGTYRDGKTDNVRVGYKVDPNSDDGDPSRSIIPTTTPNGPNINVDLIYDQAVNGDLNNFAVTIAHEGSHTADFQDWIGAGRPAGGASDITEYETERLAFLVSSNMAQSLGMNRYNSNFPDKLIWENGWNKNSWSEQKRDTERANAVDKFLSYKYSASNNSQPLTKNNQGLTFSQFYGR